MSTQELKARAPNELEERLARALREEFARVGWDSGECLAARPTEAEKREVWLRMARVAIREIQDEWW